MPQKLWAPEELFTAVDVNTYLAKQVIVICTSGSRPSSPAEGWHVYETDTDAIAKYNGSGWEYVSSSRKAFTPTLGASTTPPTLGTGNLRNGWYCFQPGPSVFFTWHILFGSSGVSAGSGTYNISLPVTPAAPYAAGDVAVGSCIMADQSSSLFRTGIPYIASGSSTLAIIGEGSAIVSNAAPWTWAAGDYIAGSVTYPI
jgi:hypothetical protein